jgi:hypothetical protein
MTEALIQMVSAETSGDTAEVREKDGRAICFVFLHAPDDHQYALPVRVPDLPDADNPEPIRASIHIRRIVECVKPITLGIGWPVMESETKGVIYLLCRNIWNESSIQAFNLDVDEGVIFEPAKIDNLIDIGFLAEFLKLFMAWSGLSQLRDLPGINEWAYACIDAEDDDPCPCGSKLDYRDCCSRYEFDPASYSK